MADIFEQVDEALREDRMRTLWRRWGWMVIALAVLIVAGTAVVVGWRSYERSVAEEQTAELTSAFAATAEAEPADAVAQLTALADETGGDIGALARMQAAARALGGDDRATAIALYRQVADDGAVDPALRELATMLAASLAVGSEDLDSLRNQLAAMEASNSPWRFWAGEIIAAAAIDAGDLALARERLTAISDDAEAPIGMRARAAELLAAIGGDPQAEAEPAPADPAAEDSPEEAAPVEDGEAEGGEQ